VKIETEHLVAECRRPGAEGPNRAMACCSASISRAIHLVVALKHRAAAADDPGLCAWPSPLARRRAAPETPVTGHRSRAAKQGVLGQLLGQAARLRAASSQGLVISLGCSIRQTARIARWASAGRHGRPTPLWPGRSSQGARRGEGAQLASPFPAREQVLCGVA